MTPSGWSLHVLNKATVIEVEVESYMVNNFAVGREDSKMFYGDRLGDSPSSFNYSFYNHRTSGLCRTASLDCLVTNVFDSTSFVPSSGFDWDTEGTQCGR